MIEETHRETPERHILLTVRSNLSITLDRLAAVFLGLSAITLLVALYPALQGYWPIMVMAVAHLVIVGWCLRLAWRRNWSQERLDIGPERVRLEQVALNRNENWEFPSAWVRVEVTSTDGVPRVFLSCHGRRRELGAFLPARERLDLARTINRGLRPHTAWSSPLSNRWIEDEENQ